MTTHSRRAPASALAALMLITLTILLLGSSCVASGAAGDAECLPEMPPPADSNHTAMVTLQMHQWVLIENLTSPDWAPRIASSGMTYEFLRPGVLRQLRLPFITLTDQRVYVNISYVINGNTLCAAALTLNRNITASGEADATNCSRVCFANFTTIGSRLNLSLLVLNVIPRLSRYREYLAFDFLEPESRASYKCLGPIRWQSMSRLPSLLSLETRCSDGDDCFFNYNMYTGLTDAGCKKDFSEFNWCISDVNLCSFNIDGDCALCCRGDLCNRELAQEVHKRWLTDKAASASASSVWMLSANALGLLLLLRSRL